MAIDYIKERAVKYVNKDFKSLKRDLIRFSQAHHSGTFQDFNESSPGMAIMEHVAFVGDVLSFYQDMQFLELKRETARQIENVVSFAKQLGYRPSGKRAARGKEVFFIEVPSITVGSEIVPDNSYAPILRKGSRVEGAGIPFETLDDLDFSSSLGRMVTGSRFDNTTGLPTHFALRNEVDIIAGETKTDTVVLGTFEQFRSIELTNSDVLEVISVFDSDGNEWTEVDFLSQESVFDLETNTDSDSSAVPNILRIVSVPRRFVTDRDPVTNKTSLVFGSGDGVSFDDQLIPNLADLALPLSGRRTFTTFPLDPQNFLKTRTLGLCPFNTTLTITYRVGGGSETNLAPNTIKNVVSADIDFSSNSLDAVKRSAVESSLECLNIQRTEGGAPEERIGEIKANSAAFFAAQNRVVTREDFQVRVLSMPEKFGRPDKVFVKKNSSNSLALDIHVLARDADDHLTLASSNLKSNIKTFLTPYRMLTDGINILDSDIINLRCKFGVVVSSKKHRNEVLAKCLDAVRDYLHVDKMQTGHPIVLSDLSSEIQQVQGVISVYDLQFSNVVGVTEGRSYSNVHFDVSANVRNQILYCPENSIFEVKFATRDIIGVAK